MLSNNAKMHIIMVPSICSIAYENVTRVPAKKHIRFYSENKFMKQNTNCQNGLKTYLFRLF